MRTRSTLIAMALPFILCGVHAQPLQLVNAFPNLTFSSPVFLTHSPDSTNRIFVLQQTGLIKVFPNDSTVSSATTFLDLTNRVNSGSERGLLGLAFHPQYATNGYFYVDYTTSLNGFSRTMISRFSVSPTDPDKADSLSELPLLQIYQPYSNHNGGMLMFGEDGYLYIGMGDGGSGGDPQNRAQNLDSLLGKILRIDVDHPAGMLNYGIPPDNPLVGNQQGYREEIYAWGVRNPWRFTEDRETHMMWLGDVGQNNYEEVDILRNGKNYGWRIMEGFHCYNPSSGCDTTGLVLPIKEYTHASGSCSITGGYVYRGYRRPDLVGAYIYADYCSGLLWELRYENGTVTSDSLLLDAPFSVTSFGVDQDNELYICNYSGNIQRFAGQPLTGERGDLTPVDFRLGQNYPNPFNPSTTIQYAVGNTAHVTITIVDLLGKIVRTLVDEEQTPGAKSVDFDASGLASGVYLYRMTAGSFSAVRKMLVLR